MKYNGGNGYTLKKLDLITNQGRVISLEGIYNSITIVEDIFSNFLYGDIIIEDANDLHQIAPIVGEETIIFNYSTDDVSDVDILLDFVVYKIETSESNTDRLVHKLYFISKEGYDTNNVMISKAYKNKSINYIISDAFSKISTKKIDITELSGNYHIISPNWTPLQLINYTTTIAKPKNYSGSLLMFYQTTHGFKYKHIEDLYSQKSLGIWVANKISKNKDGVTDEINPSNTIVSYKIQKNSTDTLRSTTEGLYSNTTLSYDNLTKTYKSLTYDYNKNYKDTVHLNNFKLISNNFNTSQVNHRISYLPSNTHRTNSEYIKSILGSNIHGDNKEAIQTWKTTLLSQMKAKEIHMEIYGNTNIIVGSVIDIEIPNSTSLKPMMVDNHRYNNKKVIITRIKHEFDRRTHKMNIVVNDDSYTDELTTHTRFIREISQ